MPLRKILPILTGLTFAMSEALPQQHSALGGSSYAGALSIQQNPASYAAYHQSWDIALAGSNLYIQKNNMLQIPAGLLHINFNDIKLKEGEYERYLRGHGKINLLNAVLRLKHNDYIAGGINVRMYGQVKTSTVYYTGNMNTSQVLEQNKNNNPIGGKSVSNNWVEGYLTYGRKLIESQQGAWIAGVTLKLIRGSFGFSADVNNLVVTPPVDATQAEYNLTRGFVDYRVSRNIERFDKESPRSKVINELLSGTSPTPGMDLGVEYVRYKSQITNGYNNQVDRSQYDFRIGASVTDLGRLSYQNGYSSSTSHDLYDGITGTVLDEKFPYKTLDEFSLVGFTDSLETIMTSFQRPGGKFALPLPAKFIVHADKSFDHHLYLGAQFVIPIAGSSWSSTRQVTELAHVMINPRWETDLAGVYFPVLVNVEGQAMFGAAIRLGPVTAGIHDLSNLSSNSDLSQGGYYLAVSVRPFRLQRKNTDCPAF